MEALPRRSRLAREADQALAPFHAELSRLVRRTQADARLPGISAAVFSRGAVVWSDAVGLADVDAAEEATTQHQYRVGSITKTFTAAAIMQLRDAGELELEDPLERHLPDAANGAPTIRRLLSHLAGIQREVPGEVWERMEFPDRAGLIDAYARAEGVLEPGAHWHYSNLAFALLGDVVARRSGSTYERYVEERLLTPVGLERTTWVEAAPAAKGYFVEPFEDVVRDEPHVDLRALRAAGQLWSTVGDLGRWATFLAAPDPDVLRPETAEEMRSFHGLADPERWSAGYGLGVQLHRDGERIFFGHTGSMPGFAAAVFCSAREGIGAAVLTNATHGYQVEELAPQLASRAAETLGRDPEPWRPSGPAPEAIAGLLGSWWSESEEWVFHYRGGRLEARARVGPDWRPPAVFEPDGDDRYRVASGPERGELLRVERDGSGEPVKLYWATYPFTRNAQTFGEERAATRTAAPGGRSAWRRGGRGGSRPGGPR